MKVECPSCKKVMMIKDEYAGKAGKCPGCGERLTLPEIGKDGSTANSGKPSPKKSGKGLWAGAIGVAAAAAAAAFYLLFFPSKIVIPDISLYNIPAERYVKRSDSLTTEAILAWQKAIEQSAGEYVSSRQLFFGLPNVDPLWQDDLFSGSGSLKYLARVEQVPLQSLRDFRTALKRASNDGTSPALSDTLLRIIEIDRLFGEGGFDRAAADQLLARLNMLAVKDVTRWAARLDAGTSQAALTLVCVDPFFKNSAFDTKRFEKQLASMQ